MITIKKFLSSIKKYYLNILSTGLILTMAAGWWGILYPQLTLNKDTVRIVTEETVNTGAKKDRDRDTDSALYREILNADRSQLRFRCRLAEEIREYLERVRRK